jgi:hypothetical protein
MGTLHRLLVFTYLGASLALHGQGRVQDEALRMSLFQFQGGAHIPGGDVAKLYGTNAAVGFSYAYKSKGNYLLGADFNYLFGNQVKDTPDLFKGLQTSEGSVIGIQGEFITILVQQRGFAAGFYGGRIFPIFGPNPNSGLVVKVGINYLEHRTWIESREADIPPLEGDYRKLYDRKRAGLAAYQFIGYQHFSNNRFANFFAGVDFYQGFTTDYRTFNVDQMAFTDGNYVDFLTGIRIGWVIPVYKQVDDRFYFK